jgi:hypothetical protein
MPAAEAWMKTKLPPHGKDHRTGGELENREREVIFPMLTTDTAEALGGLEAKK